MGISRIRRVVVGAVAWVMALSVLSGCVTAQGHDRPAPTRSTPTASVTPPHHSTAPTTAASIDNTPPGGPKPVATADAAIAIAEADTASFGGSTLLDAKLLDYGDLLGPSGPLDITDPPAGFSRNQRVWAVTFVDGFTPQFDATGASYTWGCALVDAATGGSAGTFGGRADVPSLLEP